MSDTTPNPQTSRIAIKFGASLIGSHSSSNATNRRGQSQSSSALGKRRRPNALHHDSDSGEDDDGIGRHEAVTVINTDTAADSPSFNKSRKKLVISSQKNRDWKADAKGRKQDRAVSPQSSSILNHNRETALADQDTDILWGLNVTKKSAREDTPGPDDDSKDPRQAILDTGTTLPPSPIDADKQAMDALLGRRNPTQQLIIKNSTASSKPRASETDAYQRSMQEAAEVSTIEEYSEIPEGEFGAAMLRGMGWKGEDFGSRPKEVKRRPHLMGLGSKEDEEIKKAELAKRHGHRERRPRLDEYRRDREKEKEERDGRYRDSYKSQRERERREQNHDHRHRSRYREHDNRSYR